MGLPYNLFLLYCTSAMPASVINDLLRGTASDPYITPPAEFALVVSRTKQPFILKETLPIDRLIQSDFIQEKIPAIAGNTASLTPDRNPGWSSCISVVLDERSVRDKTCVIVESTKRAGREDKILQVRIPFTLTACLFGIHTGLGLVMDDMVDRVGEDGVFTL